MTKAIELCINTSIRVCSDRKFAGTGRWEMR